MLGRLVHRSLARRPIPPTNPSRRALATQRNPWLSDKSVRTNLEDGVHRLGVWGFGAIQLMVR